MRAAQIINGVVVDYIEVDQFTPDWVMPANSKVGSRWDGHTFTNSGDDAPSTPSIPDSVPMLNAHLAIIAAGKMDLLLNIVAALPDPDRQEAQAFLNLALNCRRDNKWVLQIGPALGYDAAGLDQLFVAAAALNP